MGIATANVVYVCRAAKSGTSMSAAAPSATCSAQDRTWRVLPVVWRDRHL